MKWVVHYYTPSGKNSRRRVTFYLTSPYRGVSDNRKKSIKDILAQARRQGVKIRVKDLCLILSASQATVKRDLKALRGTEDE